MTIKIRNHTTEAFKTLARIQRTLPDALELIIREIDVIDGMPTQCIGASPPSGSTPVRVYSDDDRCLEIAADGMRCFNARPCADHDTPVGLTSVEAAAIALRNPTKILARWEAKARKLDELAADLERELTRALPKPERPLCNGGQGRDGHMEGPTGWGTTDCGRHVDYEGMCNRHIEDERVWRAANGKPERIINRPTGLAERNLTQGPGGRFQRAS